jgi:triacylglycerol esterase/lipase EstA (alpha/beta hydrolase family)
METERITVEQVAPNEDFLEASEHGAPDLPIVFCHGLLGFEKLGPFHYWRGVKACLSKLGCKTFFVEVPPTGSINDRAAALKAALLKVLSLEIENPGQSKKSSFRLSRSDPGKHEQTISGDLAPRGDYKVENSPLEPKNTASKSKFQIFQRFRTRSRSTPVLETKVEKDPESVAVSSQKIKRKLSDSERQQLIAEEFAEKLQRDLKDAEQEGKVLVKKVHLIAHSMGGLDARYMISVLGGHKYVYSLTTISTPHHGSCAASFMLKHVGDTLKVETMLKSLGIDTAAFHQLTPAFAEKFNNVVKDHPQVSYFSYAGSSDGTRVLSPMKWLAAHIEALEGPNDGLVSVKSATWGHFLGVLRENHIEQMNWHANPFSTKSLPVYKNIVRLLVEEEKKRPGDQQLVAKSSAAIVTESAEVITDQIHSPQSESGLPSNSRLPNIDTVT